MNTYRIRKKNGSWIANVIASRVDWVGEGSIHFYNVETYVAGFFPDVEVEEYRPNGETVKIEKREVAA